MRGKHAQEGVNMKVVLVNGSRRDAGCTYTALSVVAKELEAQGIETEIVAVGSRVVKGELDAVVKEVGAKVTDADGLIVGSPVYYASPTGEIMMFLDRLFGAYGNELRYKCGSSCSLLSFGFTTVSSQTFSIKSKRICAIAAALSRPRSVSICCTICSSISFSF